MLLFICTSAVGRQDLFLYSLTVDFVHQLKGGKTLTKLPFVCPKWGQTLWLASRARKKYRAKKSAFFEYIFKKKKKKKRDASERRKVRVRELQKFQWRELGTVRPNGSTNSAKIFFLRKSNCSTESAKKFE